MLEPDSMRVTGESASALRFGEALGGGWGELFRICGVRMCGLLVVWFMVGRSGDGSFEGGAAGNLNA
jgi:hypothetical protein